MPYPFSCFPVSTGSPERVASSAKFTASRVQTYLRRTQDSKVQLQSIENPLKAKLEESIIEKMKERICHFNELDDGDFRDILENLHIKLNPRFSNVLSEVGFKSVGKFSAYANSRATDKIMALTQALGMQKSFDGFKVERTETISYRGGAQQVFIPFISYDDVYELTEENLKFFLNDAHKVSVNIPYPYDTDPTAISFSGHTLHRPNHNGTHGIRKLKFVEAMMTQIAADGTDEAKAILQSFTAEERLAIKMAAFFLRAGRVNELSWQSKDNYSKRSTQLFKRYARQANLPSCVIASIGRAMEDNVKSEDRCKHINKDTPAKERLMWIILSQAHKLDLYRCFSKSQMEDIEREINTDLSPYFPAETFAAKVPVLKAYAYKLLSATGSRIHRKHEDPKQYELCSNFALDCFRACESVSFGKD